MKRSIAAILVAAFALPFAHSSLLAQDSRPGRPASAPADDRYPVVLAPPREGGACPSEVATEALATALLVDGVAERALETKRPAVVDGDTLRVVGIPTSLRLVGLDAEETFKDQGKRRLAESDWDEYVKTELAGKNPLRPPKLATPMGMAAKSGLELLLKGVESVRVEYDDAERKTDGFERVLASVFVRRGTVWQNVNVEVVRQGWSPYFAKYGRSKRFDAAFTAAEKEARAAGRGVWGPQTPYRHCDDYEVRLRWWTERADAWKAAEDARARSGDVYLLGRADEWERLKTAVGRRVTVVTTVEGYRRVRPDLGLLSCAHTQKTSFQSAGDPASLEALEAPKRFEGDLVFVTGTVELYKEQPQFRHSAADPIVISKAPPIAVAVK
jgi:endonuclease YncB( thermonuclease family)